MTVLASTSRRGGQRPVAASLLLLIALAASAAVVRAGDAGDATATPRWIDATGDLGGEAWGKSSVWRLAAVPGRRRPGIESGADAASVGGRGGAGDAPDGREVIACLSGRGLWSSRDGGEAWKRMGAPGQRPPDAGNAVRFIFDPEDPRVFWVSGMYGFGIWKTSDGGRSFRRLGDLGHVDGLGVDLADPERKTLVTCLHERTRSVHRSTDGGVSWQNIAGTIPEDANFTSDPIVIDSDTYVTNTAGWMRGKRWGIFRTGDGGASWSRASDLGAAGSPLVASDGTIYWQALWEMGLIRSTDGGKTWRKLGGPVRGGLGGPVAELPDGKLVGAGGTKLYVSADRGETWRAFGPALPFKPAGMVYSSGLRSVFVWRHTKGRAPKAIMRYDLPRDAARAFRDVRAGVLTVWDGEGFASGRGWSSPGGATFVRAQTAERRSGEKALRFHVEAPEHVGGWNWHSWALGGLTDITGFRDLAFSVKVAGERKPDTFRVELNCGPNKISSAAADVAKYAADVLDGEWHSVAIPLADLKTEGGRFDPKSTYELRVLTTSAPGSKFDVFIDDIRFEGRVAPAGER